MSWPYSHLTQTDAPPPVPSRSTSNSISANRRSSPRSAASPLSPASSSSPLAPTPSHPSTRPNLLSHRSSSSSGALGARHPSFGTATGTTGPQAVRPGMYGQRSSSSTGAGRAAAASSSSDLTEYERATSQSPYLPPTYARSALDRSPRTPDTALGGTGAGGGVYDGAAGGMGGLGLVAPVNVPPPLYLRSSSPQGMSSKGTLKIHVPAWGVVLLRPPTHHDLASHNIPARVPCEDTVLSGAIEVVMKERRRVQAISVGVQSVCRLFMGVERGWEEDGIFERGVEIMGGDSEGIWLQKGSQSFTFNLILPATLATHDYHQFGRVSYIITARVEGIAETSRSFTSFFKSPQAGSSPVLGVMSEIPYKEDFDAVIARSDRLAHDLASGSHSLSQAQSPRHGSFSGGLGLSPKLSRLSLSPEEETALGYSPLASGLGLGMSGTAGTGGGTEGSPRLNGLYHRRSSFDIVDRAGNVSPAIPPLSLPPLEPGAPTAMASTASPAAVGAVGDRSCSRSISNHGENKDERTEKNGWMKGDLVASRGLILHANPSPTGGVNQLDVRKEGYVDGLGSWRFSASADVWSISAILLLSITFPAPSPRCTLFLVRLLLQQSYTLTSPRTPNDPPCKPEQMRSHVLYQLGRAHKAGERFPTREVESLWRGPEAGGMGNVVQEQEIGQGEQGMGMGKEEGWKVRAMARVPGHDKVRPSTHVGTITPIRVTHDLVLQAFYSVDGELVNGQPTPATTTRKAGEGPDSKCATKQDIDLILSTPAEKHGCMCGSTFAELGEAAMRRMQAAEAEDREREAELEREREECRRLHALATADASGVGAGVGVNGAESGNSNGCGTAGVEGDMPGGLGLSGLGMVRSGSQGGRSSPKAEAMSRSGSLGGGGRPDGTG